MIHELTKVHWLDIKSQESNIAPVANFLRMYSEKIIPGDTSDELVVQFKDDVIKIKDLFGWTTVKQIKKKYIGMTEWRELHSIENVKNIIMTSDSIIPVYKENAKPIRGFHGEIKYPYQLRNINMINDDETIRIAKKFDTEDGVVHIKFSKVVVASVDLDKENYSEVGYEIYTKSGFYNAGDYHLFSPSDKNSSIKILYK